MFTVLYSGIRYAEPPIGKLRLSLPVRREAGLETELDVSGISEVVCPQWGADMTTILGQEDCLLLNVYVPGNNLSNKTILISSNISF